MKKLLKSLAFFAAAAFAGTAFGYGLSDSYYVFNRTWYTGSNPYVQPAGHANGAQLGEVTNLTLGAEFKDWGESDAAKHLPVLHYCFDIAGGETWHDELTIPYGHWDQQVGANIFSSEDVGDADLSDLDVGPHTISIYVSKLCDDDSTTVYDSNNNNNYTANFTLIKEIDVPTAAGSLTYDGTPLRADVYSTLVSVADEEISVTYSLAADGVYSKVVPSFTEVGDHTVYYIAEAANHEIKTGSFTVTISAPHNSDVEGGDHVLLLLFGGIAVVAGSMLIAPLIFGRP